MRKSHNFISKTLHASGGILNNLDNIAREEENKKKGKKKKEQLRISGK